MGRCLQKKSMKIRFCKVAVMLMTDKTNSENKSNFADKKVKQDPDVLIQRIHEGDGTAFDELSENYMPLINSVCSSFETSIEETEGAGDLSELRQELSFTLYRAAKAYEAGKGHATFGKYGKRCLTNCAISYLRKIRSAKKKQEKALRKLENELRCEKHQHTFDTYFNGYGYLDKKEILERISFVLSSYEFTVFNKYLEGLSAGKIAAELETDEKSVNNVVYRSKRKVAAVFNPPKSGEEPSSDGMT